jgi:triosephosphate isomerase
VIVGVSTKAYLSREQTVGWLESLAEVAFDRPSIRDGSVEVFVAPSAPLLDTAVRILDGTRVEVMAQDVSRWGVGAFTGETPAELLAQTGVTLAEVGHAERRRLMGETDEVIRAKVAASAAAGLTPLLCVGEDRRMDPADAADVCLAQVDAAASAAPLLIAYEPVWAIGADAPASDDHIRSTVAAVRSGLAPALRASRIIYGGSAGPGLLGRLHPSVDGVFLGRSAHRIDGLIAVLDEAADLVEAS